MMLYKAKYHNVDGEHLLSDYLSDEKSFIWLVKNIASGYQYGKQLSNRLNPGYEFQQYRPYFPGDDPRAIDWKLYARSEKLYLKQSIIDTDHSFCVDVDISPSMTYAEHNISKLSYAKLMSAIIAKITIDQGDACGITTGHNLLPARQGHRHLNAIFNQVFNVKPQPGLLSSPPSLNKRSTYILLSDGYITIKKLTTKLQQLASKKLDIHYLMLMGKKEMDLDFSENGEFIDLETGESLKLNPVLVREGYKFKLEAHIERIKELVSKYRGNFHLIFINDSLKSNIDTLINTLKK